MTHVVAHPTDPPATIERFEAITITRDDGFTYLLPLTELERFKIPTASLDRGWNGPAPHEPVDPAGTWWSWGSIIGGGHPPTPTEPYFRPVNNFPVPNQIVTDGARVVAIGAGCVMTADTDTDADTDADPVAEIEIEIETVTDTDHGSEADGRAPRSRP